MNAIIIVKNHFANYWDDKFIYFLAAGIEFLKIYEQWNLFKF